MADTEITKEKVLDSLSATGVGLSMTNSSGNVVLYLTDFIAEGQAPNNLKLVFSSAEIPLDELLALAMAWTVDEIELIYQGKTYRVGAMQYLNSEAVEVSLEFIK